MIAVAARRRGDPPDWLACGAVALLALAAYLPALDNGFSLDDYNHLARVRFAPSLTWFLLEPEPGEIVSPLAKAFLIGLYELFGVEARGWHAALLLLHALNAVLVYLVGARVVGSGAALVAACLFAATASGSEAVFWIAAWSHLLVTFFYLSTLLLFLRHLETGSRASLAGASVLFAAGLSVKGTFYPAWVTLVLLVLVEAPSGRRRWRSLLPFTVLLLVALAANVVFAIRQSYLIERGVYAPGWHVATGLGPYLARLAFPFRALFGRLGLDGAYRPMLTVLAVAAPVAAAAAFALGGRGARLAIVLIVLAYAPVLPFVYEPASRYAYLASVGWTWLIGLFLLRAARSHRLAAAHWLWIVPVLAAPHLCEIVLEDNEYEYREKLMSRLVADVREIHPRPPDNRTITILELPNFAIDRGIHLEAALRLAYDDSGLDLVAPGPGVEGAGDALVFSEGRIRRPDLSGRDTTE